VYSSKPIVLLFKNGILTGGFFSILLDILGKASERTAYEKGPAREMSSKYTELVMKCTWKLIKSIPVLLQDKNIKLDELILSVHVFLQAYPPAEWKRRIDDQIPQADMPLRTVKTILSMVLSAVGNSYTQWTFKIDNPEASHAVQYLEQMARSGAKKSPTPVASKPLARVASVENSEKLSESDIKSKLDSIFDMISNKDETKRGIQDLYQFQSRHPYALSLVEERLAQSGNYFQGYVRRSLAHLEETEAENRPKEYEKENADQGPAIVASDLNGGSSESHKKESVSVLIFTN
jgi:cytoskeleton-associated protein 5